MNFAALHRREPDAFESLVKATLPEALKRFGGDRAKTLAVYELIATHIRQVHKSRDFWPWVEALGLNTRAVEPAPDGDLETLILARYSRHDERSVDKLGERLASLALGGWLFGPPILAVSLFLSPKDWVSRHHSWVDAPSWSAISLLYSLLCWGILSFLGRPFLCRWRIRLMHSPVSWLAAPLLAWLLVVSTALVQPLLEATLWPSPLVYLSTGPIDALAFELDKGLSSISDLWLLSVIPLSLILWGISRAVFRRRYWVHLPRPGVGFYLAWVPILTVLCWRGYPTARLFVPVPAPTDLRVSPDPVKLTKEQLALRDLLERRVKQTENHPSTSDPHAACRDWLQARSPLFQADAPTVKRVFLRAFSFYPRPEAGPMCEDRAEEDVRFFIWMLLCDQKVSEHYFQELARAPKFKVSTWSRLRQILREAPAPEAMTEQDWRARLDAISKTWKIGRDYLAYDPGIWGKFGWPEPYFTINQLNLGERRSLEAQSDRKELFMSRSPLSLRQQLVLFPDEHDPYPYFEHDPRLNHERSRRARATLKVLLYLKELQASGGAFPKETAEFPAELRGGFAGSPAELEYHWHHRHPVLEAFGPTNATGRPESIRLSEIRVQI